MSEQKVMLFSRYILTTISTEEVELKVELETVEEAPSSTLVGLTLYSRRTSGGRGGEGRVSDRRKGPCWPRRGMDPRQRGDQLVSSREIRATRPWLGEVDMAWRREKGGSDSRCHTSHNGKKKGRKLHTLSFFLAQDSAHLKIYSFLPLGIVLRKNMEKPIWTRPPR